MDDKRLTLKELLKESYLVMQDVNHQLFTESVDEEIRISIPKDKLEFGKCHIVTWLLNRIPVYFGEIRYRHRKYSVSAYLNKAVTAMTTTALFS